MPWVEDGAFGGLFAAHPAAHPCGHLRGPSVRSDAPTNHAATDRPPRSVASDDAPGPLPGRAWPPRACMPGATMERWRHAWQDRWLDCAWSRWPAWGLGPFARCSLPTSAPMSLPSTAPASKATTVASPDAANAGCRSTCARAGRPPLPSPPSHPLTPRLLYGRIPGWGQSGPLSSAAGHDINYIALSGALHAIGRPGAAPPPPLNYLGDYGGGAVHEARQSGQGQVIDAAMTDGAALLSSLFYGLHAAGSWSGGRGGNLLDGGAHFYDSYICADGKFVAIGAIEPKFFRRLCALCGLDESFAAQEMERGEWPSMKLRLADVFRTRTRDEWCALLEGSDSCFSPVLDSDEAPAHPHNRARGSFV